jgi:hypothetical protein
MDQVNISQVNTIELKALAYDQMAQIEMAQANLRTINQELARRAQQQAGGPVPNQPPVEPLPAGSIQRV